jgi:hypothetical protein
MRTLDTISIYAEDADRLNSISDKYGIDVAEIIAALIETALDEIEEATPIIQVETTPTKAANPPKPYLKRTLFFAPSTTSRLTFFINTIERLIKPTKTIIPATIPAVM